jgi:hypothetical protein
MRTRAISLSVERLHSSEITLEGEEGEEQQRLSCYSY